MHAGAVRRRVQRGQRNVSEVFQDFRHREICHALQHARPVAPDRRQAKFVNEPELWKKTEDMVRKVLIESKINFVEVPNEAAFYGPKIDVQVWSVIGREFTLATNQVDFAVPAKFGLEYRDQRQHGEDAAVHPSRAAGHARAVHRLSHRALRRQFPALARAGTGARADIGDDEKLVDYAKPIVNELRANYRARGRGFSATQDQGKIAEAEEARVHTMLVIGPRDMEAGDVSVRLPRQRHAGAKPKAKSWRRFCRASRNERVECWLACVLGAQRQVGSGKIFYT